MELWELVAREQVRHTISSYTFGGDRGRLDELAAAFTADGVLQIESNDVSTGRAAIIERLSKVVTMDRHPTHMHHHISGTHFRSVTPSVQNATRSPRPSAHCRSSYSRSATTPSRAPQTPISSGSPFAARTTTGGGWPAHATVSR